MSKIVGLIVALVVFAIWMNIVGNPHVAETVIGLLLAVGAGLWSWRAASKLGKGSGRESPPT